ncbi:nucleotide modification associated domain-containing protein [Blattabacterium cuenoti]|uniref:nucleotide modification associated domain-containing protein n=1 Tax=Blattabacterium cuenoti TaxID=1653831 RepID=UPI00163CDF44|nr:nucleotide modification associated domain-containing protein [Blattabacterium cuenoti]
MNLSYSSTDFIIQKCKKLFLEKLKDYGLSWKFCHNYSIVDQILVKIIRIKNIQSKRYQKIKEEKIIDTYIDIINYFIIILIKLDTFFISNFHKISHYDVILIYNEKLKNIKSSIYFMEKTLNKFCIDNILEEILFLLKKKKEKNSFKELEKLCLKILVEIIFFLRKNL